MIQTDIREPVNPQKPYKNAAPKANFSVATYKPADQGISGE